ncbi:hypothetical protein PVAND_014169 [Polypedilum vanderplanki]|uniref:Uncharacterized protein n=1 Tax=Polypedilum vanderplanki TaxID=319348 RepID=A0A9J6CSS7_POLVA|nr:hypothetical protein PVAND_014169 [Polypedilum vanderplanki]
MFLWSKNYVMNKVFHSFQESVFRFREYLQYYYISDGEIEQFINQSKNIMKILKNHAIDDSKVMVIIFKIFEDLNFNTNEIIKMIVVCCEAISFEERTQLSGITIVIDLYKIGFDFILKQ